jgi:hypothetical protein
MMNISPGGASGAPTYLGGAKLKVYDTYCKAVCNVNPYGEIFSFDPVNGFIPQGIYSNQTPNGFNVSGACIANSAACVFNAGSTSGTWGSYYYLKSSVNLAGGATKVLKVRFKNGLPISSFGIGSSSPTFNYNCSSNTWTTVLNSTHTPNIDWSVVNELSMPACICSN